MQTAYSVRHSDFTKRNDNATTITLVQQAEPPGITCIQHLLHWKRDHSNEQIFRSGDPAQCPSVFSVEHCNTQPYILKAMKHSTNV
jgi:hypothetical protein